MWATFRIYDVVPLRYLTFCFHAFKKRFITFRDLIPNLICLTQTYVVAWYFSVTTKKNMFTYQ